MQTIRITITSAEPANIVLTEGATKNQDTTSKLALLLKKLKSRGEEEKL